MNAPAAPTRSRLSRRQTSAAAERARAQRGRVLEAARKCFIGSGFHAASMADIAAAADMSVGLIYRYFANKGAIVDAIIEKHLEQGECEIIDGIASPEDVVRAVMRAFDAWQGDRGGELVNAALFLDITAESARDPHIAAAVHKVEVRNQRVLAEALRRGAGVENARLDSATLRGRVQILQSLIEGLAVRSIREPGLDRSALEKAVEQCVRSLLAPCE